MADQSPAPLESPFPEASKSDAQETPVFKPPEEPEKSKNKLIPLLVILLLVALGVAGYFGWQNYQLKLKQEAVDVQPEASPVIEVDETAGWETYKEKYFEIKLPKTWEKIEPGTMNNGIIDEIRFKTQRETTKTSQHDIALGRGDVIVMVTDSSVQEAVDSSYLPKENQAEVVINNLSAFQIHGYTGIGASVFSMRTVFSSNGKSFIVDLSTQDEDLKEELIEEYKQILSTFKFQENLTTVNNNGIVTGKLCYPSEFIPLGQIVAKDTVTKKLYTQNYPGTDAGGKTSYTFSLPEGEYAIRYQGGQPPSEISAKGYYTTCSIDPNNCQTNESHKVIPVKVIKNQTTSNIDLCDFYYSSQQEPEF